MWGQASAPHRCHMSHCVTLQSASMVALSLFCELNAVSGPVWTRGRKQWVTSCHVGHCHWCQLSRCPENIPAPSSDILTPQHRVGIPKPGLGASREKTTHSSLKCPVRYFLTWNISKIFAKRACHLSVPRTGMSILFTPKATKNNSDIEMVIARVTMFAPGCQLGL